MKHALTTNRYPSALAWHPYRAVGRRSTRPISTVVWDSLGQPIPRIHRRSLQINLPRSEDLRSHQADLSHGFGGHLRPDALHHTVDDGDVKIVYPPRCILCGRAFNAPYLEVGRVHPCPAAY